MGEFPAMLATLTRRIVNLDGALTLCAAALRAEGRPELEPLAAVLRLAAAEARAALDAACAAEDAARDLA